MTGQGEALRSFQAKLVWAHKHTESLRDDIQEFRLFNPCVVVHDFDSERLKHTWRVSGPPLTPPPTISLRLGDVLYNYRAVLDHLAWDLILKSGGTPDKGTAFPICDTAADFKAAIGLRLKGATPFILTAIEELQPYNSGYPNSPNELLGLLHRLGNVEKHRHFNLITAAVELAAFSIDSNNLVDSFIHEGPVEDGTVVAVAEGQMDVDFIAAFGVAFGAGGDAAGKLVDKLIILIECAVQEALSRLAWIALK